MGRIIKANWVRRLPAKSSFKQTLEAKREHWKHERIEVVRSLVGSTERLPGVVRRIERYGVFVEINWGRGLVHISEMSKNRIRHPEEVVSLGQKVQVYVTGVDDLGRFSLSMIGPAKSRATTITESARCSAIERISNTTQTCEAVTDHQAQLPSKVIDGGRPMRNFAELAAYWENKRAEDA